MKLQWKKYKDWRWWERGDKSLVINCPCGSQVHMQATSIQGCNYDEGYWDFTCPTCNTPYRMSFVVEILSKLVPKCTDDAIQERRQDVIIESLVRALTEAHAQLRRLNGNH
jgi:hypothetical protein